MLHAACEKVAEFGPSLAQLVEDLFATMYAARGVGLAANQVGVALRVFVYDCPDDEDVRHLGHLVNPRLVGADGVIVRGAEGCLSLPGVEAGTPRFDRAVVEGFSATGEPVTVDRYRILRSLSAARVRSPRGHRLHRPAHRLAPT